MTSATILFRAGFALGLLGLALSTPDGLLGVALGPLGLAPGIDLVFGPNSHGVSSR
jgi:hypothetical protein